MHKLSRKRSEPYYAHYSPDRGHLFSARFRLTVYRNNYHGDIMISQKKLVFAAFLSFALQSNLQATCIDLCRFEYAEDCYRFTDIDGDSRACVNGRGCDNRSSSQCLCCQASCTVNQYSVTTADVIASIRAKQIGGGGLKRIDILTWSPPETKKLNLVGYKIFYTKKPKPENLIAELPKDNMELIIPVRTNKRRTYAIIAVFEGSVPGAVVSSKPVILKTGNDSE